MPDIDIAAFLRGLPEFQQTPRHALVELAERCEVWSFHEGDLVRFADEPSDGRMWVGEGCLASAPPEQPPRFIGVREEADAPLGHWIRGQTEGWYVRLPAQAWNRWNRATGTAYGHVFRQSRTLLAIRCVLPLLFIALFAAFGVLLSGLGTDVPVWALWLLPGAGMLIAVAWGALTIHEWRRSFVALAGTGLEIRRLDLGAREAVFETLAADRVRQAVLTRRGFWGMLGVAELELETDLPDGSPGARFRFFGLPVGCGLTEALETVPKLPKTDSSKAWAARAGRAPTLTQPAMPEPTVWFRRHWWFLAQKCVPWLGWCALLAFVAAWAAELWPQGAVYCAVAAAIVALAPLGAIVWEAWDWANDRLGVTAGQVVLLRRRPLWFGETRHEAPLDQVEQLGVLRTGLAALVLDFGAVTVRLGQADPLEFEGLARPEIVRQTVLARRAAVFASYERQAAVRRFDEVADIVETWDKGQKSGYWDGEKS